MTLLKNRENCPWSLGTETTGRQLGHCAARKESLIPAILGKLDAWRKPMLVNGSGSIIAIARVQRWSLAENFGLALLFRTDHPFVC